MTDTNGAQSGATLKYLPFGLCLESQGNLGTTKLFTGQRLDATGLYYYNARYYDPLIGRFISPDTVVQDFSNPQTLNRYTYCANNPLIYTDPSGNIVDFGYDDAMLQYHLYGPNGTNMSEVAEFRSLVDAWVILSTVDPNLTGYIANAAETVTIQWGNVSNGISSTTKASDWNSTGNINITIDNSVKGSSTDILTSLLGHEDFHAAMHISQVQTWQVSTVANEAFAYSFGDLVSQKLNCQSEFETLTPLSGRFNNINPFSDVVTLGNQLKNDQGILSSNGYKTVRGGSTSDLNIWPGFNFLWFHSGRNSFLTVAKSVWIK